MTGKLPHPSPQIEQVSGRTFSEDFSSQEPGTTPSGWTPIRGNGQSWTVLHRDRGRELSGQGSPEGPRMVRWDAAGDVADGEILALMSSTSRHGTQLQVALRATGSGRSARGYSLSLGDSGLHIDMWAEGVLSALARGQAVNFIADTWYWLRFRAHGTQLKGKAWEAGTPEPVAWSVEHTDSTIAGIGGVAVGGYSASGTTYVDYVSATSGNGSAPPPPDTIPGSHTCVPYQVGHSTQGMVASMQPLATAAGNQMLQQGGNAVDAAVATAFALAVVEPSQCSIGGRTMILIRRPSGECVGVDGFTEVPLSYDGASTSAIGYKTVAIPGTVAALAQAQQQYGTMPLAEVMAPAITYARDGFVLNTIEATRMAMVGTDLFPSAREYFLEPEGTPYTPGDIVVQSDLADVLAAIAAEGPEVFYKGWIAQRIEQDMIDNGGYLTLVELSGYTAKPAITVTNSYRGYTLTGAFRPASGHQTIETLNIMELFDLPACAADAPWASITHQAMERANNDKDTSPGATEHESAAVLTSKDYAQQRSQNMTDHGFRLAGPPGSGAGEPSGSKDPMGTTTMSAADSHGGMVALTQSIGPSMGSRVATPGLGFLWGSTLGYDATGMGDTPGTRPRLEQTPMIVEKNGQPILALGGAGGPKIVPIVVQTLTRYIDQGLSLPDAVAAPRQFNTGATTIDIEEDRGLGVWWPETVLSDLEGMGYTITRNDGSEFGRVAAIAHNPATGEFTGVADPRRIRPLLPQSRRS